jgi:hypothetical protein
MIGLTPSTYEQIKYATTDSGIWIKKIAPVIKIIHDAIRDVTHNLKVLDK